MNALLGLLCIFLFSVTVPATRLLALEIPGEAVALLRLGGAGVFCLILVLFVDPWVPPRKAWGTLARTSLGSVFGFSLLISLAMQTVPASHGAIGLAAMPALTALYGSIRDRSRMGKRFWVFALLATVVSFSYFALHAEARLEIGDLYLVGATLASAFGYVEGGRLSREYGGRRVMTWAILGAVPPMLLTAFFLIDWNAFELSVISARGWGALAYIVFISQSMGMFLWYRVLSRGSIPKLSLIQLLQPFFTLAIAVAVLGESVPMSAWVASFLVGVGIVAANLVRSKT